MDTRRLLIAAPALLAATAGLSSCAVWRTASPPTPSPRPEARQTASLATPSQPAPRPAAAAAAAVADDERAAEGLSGPPAIAAANETARTRSRGDAFVGGVQVFRWSPGRVFEVWAAPLRVTTLTLGRGETLIAKAAGDTVRWQIGEAASGAGAARRTHVLLKPFEAGLETNLVLTTSRRVYHIELRSGASRTYNAAVAWDDLADVDGDADNVEPPAQGGEAMAVRPEADAALNHRYRVTARGRVKWAPVEVFDDGTRTFIRFPEDLHAQDAPVLFVIDGEGTARLVNYRQTGRLYSVDRLFERAELRLGARRPQIVRIERLPGGAR